jgi:hypothetical protein
MNTRQRWLALALVATLAAAFWPGREDSGEVVETVRHADRAVSAAGSKLTGEVAQQAMPVARERLAPMQANLFPTQTWVPPPPPPKPYIPLPPPPPRPPPLPFKYLGRWVDDGQETLFLAVGEEPILVQPGQVLLGKWRVDQITERTVVFTYLPLDMQSILGFTP